MGNRARVLRSERKQCVFRYRSAAHCVDIFRRYYGPTHKAFEALPAEGQAALERDMLALLERHNRAGDAALVAPAELALGKRWPVLDSIDGRGGSSIRKARCSR